MLSGNVILIKIRKSLCNDGSLWGHNTKIIKGGKFYSTQHYRKCDYKSGVGSDMDISRHRFIQLDTLNWQVVKEIYICTNKTTTI